MTYEEKITRSLGGNHWPMSSSNFIIAHLAMGEDYPANMHRAYKEALDQLAAQNGRRYAYHKPRYHSFNGVVQKLTRAGKIEFSGREEESDNPRFDNWEVKPLRRYYRLMKAA